MSFIHAIQRLSILFFIILCGGGILTSCADQQERTSVWRNYDAGTPQLSHPKDPPKAHFGSCNAKDLKEFSCD